MVINQSSTLALSGVELGTIIVTLLSFSILLILLSKFAWGPLMDMLKQREDHIIQQVEQAEKASEEAQVYLEQNKQAMQNAQQEIQQLLTNAELQAKTEKEKMLADAKQQAEQLKENAQRDIENEKQRAISQINKEVANLSVAIASKLMKKELTLEDQKAYIQNILAEEGQR